MLVMMIQPILIMAALDYSHLKVIKQLCVRSTIEGHSRAKLGWILPHDDNRQAYHQSMTFTSKVANLFVYYY